VPADLAGLRGDNDQPRTERASGLALRSASARSNASHSSLVKPSIAISPSLGNGRARRNASRGKTTNLGKLNVVIPPTDERFSARQGHWYRIENNELAEHLLSGMTSPRCCNSASSDRRGRRRRNARSNRNAGSRQRGHRGVRHCRRRDVAVVLCIEADRVSGVGAVVVVSGAVIVLADVGDVVEMLDVPPRSLRLSTGRNRHPQPRARRRSLPILDRGDSVQNGRSVGLRLDLSTW